LTHAQQPGTTITLYRGTTITKLPYDRLAAFSLGVMTIVLLLAPAGKAESQCSQISDLGARMDCQEADARLRSLELRQTRLENRLRAEPLSNYLDYIPARR
jgi:hypothetical protein